MTTAGCVECHEWVESGCLCAIAACCCVTCRTKSKQLVDDLHEERGGRDDLLGDEEKDSVTRVSKRGRPSCKADIRALLGRPQREAAEVLGISESMSCKRYKECNEA